MGFIKGITHKGCDDVWKERASMFWDFWEVLIHGIYVIFVDTSVNCSFNVQCYHDVEISSRWFACDLVGLDCIRSWFVLRGGAQCSPRQED